MFKNIKLTFFEQAYLGVRLYLRLCAREDREAGEKKPGDPVYIISYLFEEDRVQVFANYTDEMTDTDIWFRTREAAQEALDHFGEKRLKKYYFCVEGNGGFGR